MRFSTRSQATTRYRRLRHVLQSRIGLGKARAGKPPPSPHSYPPGHHFCRESSLFCAFVRAIVAPLRFRVRSSLFSGRVARVTKRGRAHLLFTTRASVVIFSQMKSPTESLESPSDATDEQKLVLDTPSPSSRSSLGVQMATKEQNDQNVDYNSGTN